MHIQIRKEMDDKLRLERNSLKTALDSAHGSEKDKAVAEALKQKERDIKSMETHFQEERNKLLKRKTSNNQRRRNVLKNLFCLGLMTLILVTRAHPNMRKMRL